MSRRTHEIGLRVALGADRGDVLRLTLGQVLRVTAVGIGVGLLAAYGVGLAMESALFGTVRLDASTYVGLAFAWMEATIPTRTLLSSTAASMSSWTVS